MLNNAVGFVFVATVSYINAHSITNGSLNTNWLVESSFQLYSEDSPDTSGCFRESWNNASVLDNGFTYVIRKVGYRVLMSTETAIDPDLHHEMFIGDKTFIVSGNNHSAFENFHAKDDIESVSANLLMTSGNMYKFLWDDTHSYAAKGIKASLCESCRLYIVVPSVKVDSYECHDEPDFVNVCDTKKTCSYLGTKQADAKFYDPVHGTECQ